MVEREIPDPGPRQVRLKVQACGLCHSDSLTKEATGRESSIPACRDTRSQEFPSEFWIVDWCRNTSWGDHRVRIRSPQHNLAFSTHDRERLEIRAAVYNPVINVRQRRTYRGSTNMFCGVACTLCRRRFS